MSTEQISPQTNLPESLTRLLGLMSRFAQRIAPLPSLILAVIIITYTLYFSWYTINRHNTLNSYAADLSLIDQPMWNTLSDSGNFMELTWGDRQQPRLAEHFEPILIPLSLLFLIWDDVRILLIAQSLALALGALPIFWIARYRLTNLSTSIFPGVLTLPSSSDPDPVSQPIPPSLSAWTALTFSIAYLLFPHLQAANIADFHADPFVVTPLLFAFWYATQNQWPQMWFWAIIAMLTKETLPTLTAMLGLLLILDFYRTKTSIPPPHPPISPSAATSKIAPQSKTCAERSRSIQNPKSKIQNGFALIIISAVWFLIATFFIVAPLARQHFGTDGPIYLANRFDGGLSMFSQLFQDSARWQYLLGFFAATAFLPLLAPELLILGLPVLVANMFSNFPGQYSGEQHYSASLVAAFILAAIYGTHRLINKISLRESKDWSLKQITLVAVCLWLMAWSLAYHTLHGWTPLSMRTEIYSMSPAAAQLPNFTALIPPQAVVSASAGLHPHIAHRRVAYLFPIVKEADYLLVDVTDIPGIHPNDAHTKIIDMLNHDWQILQANQGLILAQKSPAPVNSVTSPCSPAAPLPCTFFTITHPTTPPATLAPLTFGDGQLRLLGYTIHDDPDDGVSFRFYWQATDRLPETLKLWPLIYNDLGQLLNNPVQVPMVATVWYPPSVWKPGETVVTETLPQPLPNSFYLGLAVGSTTNSFGDPTQRWPITGRASNTQPQLGHWVQLAGFKRQGPFLTRLSPQTDPQAFTPIEAQFGATIQLTGFWLDTHNLNSGESLPILLKWIAKKPPITDFTVFIHVLSSAGDLVAQSDTFPTWLVSQPTSQWPLNQPILDSHILNLPPNLPPDIYTIQVGLYNAQTLERLTLPNNNNAFQLTQIQLK